MVNLKVKSIFVVGVFVLSTMFQFLIMAQNSYAQEEYIAYDAIYAMDDVNINRATSEHFQLIWGKSGAKLTNVTTEFIDGNLKNLEAIRNFYINDLHVNDPGISRKAEYSNVKRKSNLYITETGLTKHQTGFACMSSDDIGMGYMIISPDGMRVSPPSWVVPHEFGHVVTMYLKGWNENNITGAWWEPLANWFADKYTLSDYYTNVTVSHLPESNYIEPFLRNMDLASPHMANYYHYYALFHYLEENPDNLSGLGKGFMNKLVKETNMNEYPFDAIQRLSGTSIKEIMGNFAKRIPTQEFFNPANYTTQKYNEILKLYRTGFNTAINNFSGEVLTQLLNDGGNTWKSPDTKAPQQGGINLIKLYPNTNYNLAQGINVTNTVNFSALQSERTDGDFRLNLVKILKDGSSQYSELWSSGTKEIEINSNVKEVYLVVVATPNLMIPTSAFDQKPDALKRFKYKIDINTNVTSIPATPIPATSIPATPIPATPIPVTPIPVTPIPATPIPATPIPATPIPVKPIPATPIPVAPIPATPTSAIPSNTPTNGITVKTIVKVDDKNSAILYNGNWLSSLSSSFYKGSTKYTSNIGDSASFSFTGTEITWVARKYTNRGKATVYIDGVSQGIVSLYAGQVLNQKNIYTKKGLTNTPHTIKIVALDAKRIDLDAFIYTKVTETAKPINTQKPDDYGNFTKDAQSLQVGQKMTGKIDFDGDVDCFKFMVSKTGAYDITVSGLETSISLLNSKGGLLKTSISKFASNLTQGNQYYIKVKNVNIKGTGNYTVYIKGR